MSTREVLAATLLILATSGCAFPPKVSYVQGLGSDRVGFSSHIKGYVGEKNGEYGFVDLSKISFSGQSLEAAVLNPVNSVIQTKHIIKFNVTKVPRAYDILFGPPLGSDDTAVGWLKNPSFLLGHGWIYLFGFNVSGGTNWAEAGAEGCSMIIQTDTNAAGEEVHRFYFIEGTRAWVQTREDPADIKSFTDEMQYMEVELNGTDIIINDPVPIPAAGPIHEFVTTVLEIAGTAGMT